MEYLRTCNPIKIPAYRLIQRRRPIISVKLIYDTTNTTRSITVPKRKQRH